MNRAIVVNRIAPVVDHVFPFDSVPAAYRYQASGAFVGKVVIAVTS
jgi:NADPH:quinone reductase-like Zn-dependent oxidoreductase